MPTNHNPMWPGAYRGICFWINPWWEQTPRLLTLKGTWIHLFHKQKCAKSRTLVIPGNVFFTPPCRKRSILQRYLWYSLWLDWQLLVWQIFSHYVKLFPIKMKPSGYEFWGHSGHTIALQPFRRCLRYSLELWDGPTFSWRPWQIQSRLS